MLSVVSIHPTNWTSELDSRYEVLEEAGRGGMGVVYKARDKETSETVALKILKPDIASDPVAAERFINEVRLSRRITHKNVCRVYEFTRAGSTAYLSMEYVEGESLRSIVERMGAVNVRKGVQIARQICAALHEAHAQGVVHRDLKPENVMLDKSGNVKVMDFGIARLLDTSVTATAGGIIGTPAYMAPEQAEGREVDARTDIYALGLILYEIFTGKSAFSGDSPMVVALKQIREMPSPPHAIEPSLPSELDAAIMRCLAKDPSERFQSVEELDAALAAIASPNTTTGNLAVDPQARKTGVPTWPTVAKAETAPLGERKPDGPDDAGRSRRNVAIVGVIALVAIAGAVAAYLSLRPKDPIPFTKFTLNNGLRVILAEDHSAPTVAVAVTYDVGAKDDPPGREGLAHLFEHMLFNGSLNVGKGEHHYLVTKEGGSPNGQTFMDQTHVWETLPSNQLELALFLEADRMRSLRLDQARLDTERGTVVAERQQRVDNAAYGRALDALYGLAYDRINYKKSHFGTDEGLQKITLQEVNDFFRVFYAPNNAVLTIVGDFDPGDARKKIENYFQHIPAQPPAPRIDLSEPDQTAERRARIDDQFGQIPRTYLAYKIPPGSGRDTEALTVLAGILYDGASSRLHQKLVKERELAIGVGGALDPRKGPGVMLMVLQPAPGRDEATLLKAYDEVVAQIREQGISDTELQRARTRIRMARATAMQQTVQRATLLGEFEVKFGGAENANERSAWLASITVDDVKRVANQFLAPERRSILTVATGGKGVPTVKAAATPPGATVSSVERLNRAPVSKEIVKVSLPSAKEQTLGNGLSLMIAEDRRVPLVSARFEIRGAGSLTAPGANRAIPIAAGAMLREGTVSRSSRDIAEAFDQYGVQVSTGEANDAAVMVIQATGLSDTFASWFPLVADIVTNASFPADELTLMKRRLVGDWQSRRSAPMTAATEVLDQALYGTDAARPLDPNAIGALTRDQLQAWHRERYAPQNTVVAIAGAIGAGEAEKVVREALDGWTKTSYTEVLPTPPTAPGARVFIINRPGSVQTTLLVGTATVDRANSDLAPLIIANRVLGGSSTSRLFVKLREERGLTYGTFSQVNGYKHGGDWRAWVDFSSSRLTEATEAFLGELRRISEPVPEPELDDAKRSIAASFALTLESLSQVVSYMTHRRGSGLSTDYWERFPEKLMSISQADTQKVARIYMDMSKLQIVAVGDAEQLEPVLKPLGEIVIVK